MRYWNGTGKNSAAIINFSFDYLINILFPVRQVSISMLDYGVGLWCVFLCDKMSKTESNGRRQRVTKCQNVFHFRCFIDFFYLSWRNLMNTQHPDLIDCLRLCAISISFKSHFCRSFWIVEYMVYRYQFGRWSFFLRTGSFCCDFHHYCVFCRGFSGFVYFFLHHNWFSVESHTHTLWTNYHFCQFDLLNVAKFA